MRVERKSPLRTVRISASWCSMHAVLYPDCESTSPALCDYIGWDSVLCSIESAVNEARFRTGDLNELVEHSMDEGGTKLEQEGTLNACVGLNRKISLHCGNERSAHASLVQQYLAVSLTTVSSSPSTSLLLPGTVSALSAQCTLSPRKGRQKKCCQICLRLAWGLD